MATMKFPVTLSPASSSTVTVQYQCINQTAASPTDYTSTTGTLTFAPGVTTQYIEVNIIASPTADADKEFEITLSNPVNAILSTSASAEGVISTSPPTIPGSVSPAVPIVSIGSVASEVDTVIAGFNPVIAVGNQFVDSVTNLPIRLCGVNWYGYDGTDLIVHGLYAGRGYQDVIDQMSALGFNAFRLPFCDDMITSTVTFVNTSGNQYVVQVDNPDLIGLTPMQALDCIVYYAYTAGMRIILDHHRISMTSINSADSGYGTDGWPAANPEGGALYHYAGAASGGSTYTPEVQWRAMWVSMATHFTTDHTIPGSLVASGVGKYASNASLAATIVGFDPHNEPKNLAWATWAGMVETLFPFVNAIAPNWMMFVEGVAGSANGSDLYWEGGYLKSAGPGSVDGAARPINLGSKQNKLAYSCHEYGQSVYGQTWMNTLLSSPGGGYPSTVANTVIGYPNNLYAIWDEYFGFIYKDNIAPLWMGEFGGGFGRDYSTGAVDSNQANAAFELQWGNALVNYLQGYNVDGSSYLSGSQLPPSFAYFALNPESGNPLGGLLWNVDYITPDPIKMGVILPLLSQS